jgi:hypothetical protein
MLRNWFPGIHENKKIPHSPVTSWPATAPVGGVAPIIMCLLVNTHFAQVQRHVLQLGSKTYNTGFIISEMCDDSRAVEGVPSASRVIYQWF